MSDLSTAALHLLEALAAEGAYAVRAKREEPGILVVVGQWNGISLRRTSAPLAAAEELAQAGFAVWDGSPRMRRRLVLTACGRAKQAESQAPADIVKGQRFGKAIVVLGSERSLKRVPGKLQTFPARTRSNILILRDFISTG